MLATRNNKKWDVIKKVRLHSIDNTNGTTRYVFKDLSRRVYYVDREDNGSITENLKLGDEIYVWVIKELETYGFVRTEIDDKSIIQFLDDLKVPGKFKLYDSNGRKTLTLFLGNYIRFSDKDFYEFKESGNEVDIIDSLNDSCYSNRELRIKEALSYAYRKFILGDVK